MTLAMHVTVVVPAGIALMYFGSFSMRLLGSNFNSGKKRVFVIFIS